MKTAYRMISRLRARLGALPQVPATFLKKGRSKTFVIFGDLKFCRVSKFFFQTVRSPLTKSVQYFIIYLHLRIIPGFYGNHE